MSAEDPVLNDAVDDWVEAIGVHEPEPELSTVGPRFAVVHQGTHVHRHEGLEPGSDYERDGISFTTLPEPGRLLTTFATVNDVHFGETECGIIDGSDIGPVLRVAPGAPPFPETMNRGAVAEMAAIGPSVVIVKGDLTSNGTEAEYEAFRAVYEPPFGDRLMVVRGNHESYNHAVYASEAFQVRVLDGVVVVLLDTSVDGAASGTVTTDQLDAMEAVAAEADRPVLVFGHHQLGDPRSRERADRTFGIDLEASAAFLAAVPRQPMIRGVFAGHTHRNRVRRFTETGDVVWAEVACVKDYPGSWAEYRVHEDGILQIHHRISTPEALAWSEQARHMYAGLYHDYAFGRIEDRCFVLPASPKETT